MLTDDRYGFGLDEFFNLVDVLRQFCDEVQQPDLSGLVDRLADALRYRLGESAGGGLPQGPISIRGGFDVDSDQFALVLETDLVRTFSTELTEEGFGPEANGLGLDLAIPATATVGFRSEVTLAMSLAGALNPPNAGIAKGDVSLQVSRLETSLNITAPDIDATATLGFLTAAIVDGRATLNTGVDFAVNGTPGHAGPVGDRAADRCRHTPAAGARGARGGSAADRERRRDGHHRRMFPPSRSPTVTCSTAWRRRSWRPISRAFGTSATSAPPRSSGC